MTARWAIQCGQLIDATGNQPRLHVSVLVEGNRIVAVQDQEEAIPAGFEVIDLGEATMMPGLIDVHAHLTSPHSLPEGGAGYDVHRAAYIGAHNARQALLGGVTTVRDVGSPAGVAAALKHAVESRWILGARVVSCGQIICTTGGHAFTAISAADSGIGVEADGSDAMRREVRCQIKAGADAIKIAVTHHSPVCEFTREELDAVVDEATRHLKRVACHAANEPGIAMAIDAGVTSIEHGYFANPASIDRLVEAGIYLVPTISIACGMLDQDMSGEAIEAHQRQHVDRRGWTQDRRDAALAYTLEKASSCERTVRYAVAAGAKIAVGTDAPLGWAKLPLDAARNEVMHLVRLGMSPQSAIEAGTRVSSEVAGVDELVGTVETGKLADLIAVDGDPIRDIRVLDRVAFVMKEGEVVRSRL